MRDARVRRVARIKEVVIDINELLKGVDCDCGKHHSCDIKYVYVEKNAIDRLRVICKDFEKILLVADENTFAAAGEKTVKALSKKCLEKEKEIRRILKEMPSAEEIKEMLCRVGLDIKELFELYGEAKIVDAVLYSKDLKDRYTVLWMNYDLSKGN